ncbi:spore cortex-lytic enzyme [Carboxydothermus hydrogenoformans]|uniref:Spore cortex-lytic enzyme n=1 Tax=Carboxydothermus hydrogenoformans (strain ATCC BAA-161 / DSM 6008 / Z-2901) TaxID=246194 RepID=Q3ABA8_CARHZ|nr:spore cortex-lytic enzyme [Carboxydothermus hydrogenoformans]ABB16067.1 putative spore cortex-lytic enzyme [Carboxydothermus hydrogenoformans Z-2901]
MKKFFAVFSLIFMLLLPVAVVSEALASQVVYYKVGSYGSKVLEIERKLVSLGYKVYKVDKYFDVSTKKAVMAFQKKEGLKVDGIVGPVTMKRLIARTSTSVSRSAFRISPEDQELLARMVEAEAGGEPYLGKVAVAAVILNRVKSPLFPNDVRGVILQKGAFEPILNGWFWQVTVSAESKKAVADALRGIDPSNGALYFYNPAKSNHPWFANRVVTARIGNHVFTK